METLLHKRSYRTKSKLINISRAISLPIKKIPSLEDSLTVSFSTKKVIIDKVSLKDDWTNFTNNLTTEMLAKISIC